MRTEPPFNIETPQNPWELKPAEKGNPLDNDQLKKREDEPKKKEVEKEKVVLPPDPFGNKGKNIDILG
jgi:hypothetical protein